jgi:hypothetical protein
MNNLALDAGDELGRLRSSKSEISVNIIDFSLSRAGRGDDVTWGGLDDESIFGGEGEPLRLF